MGNPARKFAGHVCRFTCWGIGLGLIAIGLGEAVYANVIMMDKQNG